MVSCDEGTRRERVVLYGGTRRGRESVVEKQDREEVSKMYCR